MKKNILFILIFFASFSVATPELNFVSPTPLNGVDNYTYGMIFNFSSNETMNGNGYIEIDGVNKTCTIASDNLSCAYTLTYANHLYNNSYNLIAWGNFTTYESNTTAYEFEYFGCGKVNSNATILEDISAANSTCLTFGSNSMTINCDGHKLTGDNSTDTNGIYSAGFNSTVKNCIVTSFDDGIYYRYADNGTIDNTTVEAFIPGGKGIWFGDNANSNTITNSVAKSNDSIAIYVQTSYYSTIINTTAESTSNTGIGYVSGNNGTLNNVTAITSGGYAFTINSNYVSITNSTILGNGVNSIGLQISGADYCNFTNLYIYGDDSAIYMNSGASNNIINNSIINSSNFDTLYCAMGGGNYNIFSNNTFVSDSQDLATMSTTCYENTFYWNNFTNTSGYYVYDLNGTNHYNTSEGNIYFNVLNNSVEINGSTHSIKFPTLYVGNSGSGYPYSNTTSNGKFLCEFTGCGDYAPLTNQLSPPLIHNSTLNYTNYSSYSSYTILNYQITLTDTGTYKIDYNGLMPDVPNTALLSITQIIIVILVIAPIFVLAKIMYDFFN